MAKSNRKIMVRKTASKRYVIEALNSNGICDKSKVQYGRVEGFTFRFLPDEIMVGITRRPEDIKREDLSRGIRGH